MVFLYTIISDILCDSNFGESFLSSDIYVILLQSKKDVPVTEAKI